MMISESQLSPDILREQFYGWQCRIRQISMRDNEGRPSPGMNPQLSTVEGKVLLKQITTLILRGAPEESTEYLKFQVQKTHDPKEVRDKTLKYLQSTHYHNSKSFSDQLAATFKPNSEFARDLVALGKCVLEFNEFSQGYILSCDVREVIRDDPFHAATLWHNRAFNPNLPDNISVLSFIPNWHASGKIPGTS